MTSLNTRLPHWLAMAGACLLLLSADFALAQSVDRSPKRASSKQSQPAKNSKVEVAFPKSTRQEPNFKMSAKLGAKVQKAQEALAEEDFAKAETIFNEILNSPKASAGEKGLAYQGLGNIAYEREEDPLKVIDYNNKAVETDTLPNITHFGLMLFNAQLYLQEDKFDEAILWADRWIRETGEEKDTLLVVKGQSYYQQEKFDLAAAALKRAIEVSEKPSDSWFGVLMSAYMEGELYDEAISYGESVLAKDPNNKTILRQLSNVYIEKDQEPKALALMDRAYATGLLSTEAELRQLAQLYAYAEKPEQGAKVLQDGIAKGILKEDLKTLSLLGEVYSQGEDHLKTAEAYGRAAQFAPDGDMKFRQAYALYDAEKIPEARAAALEALKKTPFKHEGECWVILGNMEIELNNKAAAIKAFENAAKFPTTKKNAETWLKNARRM